MVDVCANKNTLHVVVLIPGNEGKVRSAADAFFAHVQDKVNGNLSTGTSLRSDQRSN